MREFEPLTGDLNINKEVKEIIEEVNKEVLGKTFEATEEASVIEIDKNEQEKLYAESFVNIEEGDILEGIVVGIESDGVLVDIGYKTEGFIPLDQLSFTSFTRPEEVVKIGDKIETYVMKVGDEEGRTYLSKKRADLEAGWHRVTKAHLQGEVLTATVVERVKGGLIVDLGLRGFVPASQIHIRPVRNLDDYIGEVMRLKVLEIDRTRRKVILSQKAVLEEEKEKLRDETLKGLKEGQIRKGRIARITNFGAFVDLGGVDGLIHLSELSWRRVRHPSEVVKVGDEVEVMVLSVDKEKERISLSLRQATPDPWLLIKGKFKEGNTYEGKVSKLAKKYAFVELEEGIEGLVPISEITDKRISRPGEVISLGDKVKVKILEINQPQRRMILSIKAAEAEADAKEYYQRLTSLQAVGGTTIGELLLNKPSGEKENK